SWSSSAWSRTSTRRTSPTTSESSAGAGPPARGAAAPWDTSPAARGESPAPTAGRHGRPRVPGSVVPGPLRGRLPRSRRPFQPARRLLQHGRLLAEREPYERRPRLPVVVEDRGRDGDDARAFRQGPAEGDAVGLAPGADVGGDEVGAGGAVDRETRLLQPGGEEVPLAAQVVPQPREVRLGPRERLRDRVLEGSGGSGDPADLPAGEGEGLAGTGDGDRAVAHAGEGRQGDVFGVVEDEVFVDLVGHDEEVPFHGQLGDRRQLRAGEDRAGGVVRGV